VGIGVGVADDGGPSIVGVGCGEAQPVTTNAAVMKAMRTRVTVTFCAPEARPERPRPARPVLIMGVRRSGSPRLVDEFPSERRSMHRRSLAGSDDT
jgi:hypothetical protein